GSSWSRERWTRSAIGTERAPASRSRTSSSMQWRRCPLSTKAFAVLRKEITDTLRDGRSVFAIFIFPFILYPAMLFFSSYIQSKNMEAARELQVRVGVVGSEALPFVVDSLAALQGVTPVPMTAVPSDIE